MVELAELLDYYQRYISFLDDDEEEALEAYSLVVLTTRDELEDRWAELNKEQRQRVLAKDARLCRKHRAIASVLPGAHPHDRRRWWWFLHEGPQVRQQARSGVKRPPATAL